MLHGYFPLSARLQPRQMTHLTPRTGFLFTVKVQGPCLGKRLPGARLVPDDVFHHRIGMAAWVTQWPARHSADMLLQPGALARLEGPTARDFGPGRRPLGQQPRPLA